MPESASVVVSRPLSDVEAQLWTVTNWASCLTDVVSVRRASHERYTFEIKAGRKVDEVLVAVRWNARHHKFAWKALDGPAWAGELRLSAVNGRRTRLELAESVVPRTFLGNLAEMVGITRCAVHQDLAQLEDLILQLPEPVRPSRLVRAGEPTATPQPTERPARGVQTVLGRDELPARVSPLAPVGEPVAQDVAQEVAALP